MDDIAHSLPKGMARHAREASRRLFDWLSLCRARSRERHFLLTMTDAQLRDIGITRCEATREAEKPFWHP